MDTPFKFDIALEAFEKADAGEGKERRIGGVVSTDHLDRQDEVLLQNGLDLEPFLKAGWFNDNHSTETDSIVGYPEFAELRDLGKGRKGWYVEGYILKGTDRADKIWQLANSLQKTDRKLGFSVEGSIVERDPENPKVVKKAVVREVAITKCPVNTATSLGSAAFRLRAPAWVLWGRRVAEIRCEPLAGSASGARFRRVGSAQWAQWAQAAWPTLPTS